MKKQFRTHTFIKDILGKGMINDDNLAIIELVKNSIDANAKLVEIDFKYLTAKTTSNLFEADKNRMPSPTIIIKDNGQGMDEEDIEKKWLNIAYSEKKDKSDTTSQVFAGDKGVGRFSSDRLGRFLNLYTKKNNKPIYHVKIDWQDFEKGDINTTIQSINIEVNQIAAQELKEKGYELPSQGTIIEMINLRATWTKTKIKELKVKYLAKLINPNQSYVKNNVVLNLQSPDYIDLSGKIENLVFKNLQFRTTSIEAFTTYNKEKDELLVTTILRHKGVDVLTIIEVNDRFKALKDVRIVIYYLNSYAKVRFYKEAGERTKDYGSIFLFLNGFRVSPYGEAENDWLGLEMRRSQGQQRFFSARDIVGRIEVTDFEGNFKAVSSREGLVKDNVFSLLVDRDAVKDYDEEDERKEYGFFYQIVTALEKYVVNGLKWDSALSTEYINEFEEKMAGTDLIMEKYAETDSEKDKRCLEAVQSILRTRKGKIVDIDINNDLILQLLEEDEERIKKTLKNLEKHLPKMTGDTASVVDKIKQAFKEKEVEIERQRAALSESERKRKVAEVKVAQEEKARKTAEEKANKSEKKAQEAELKRKQAELKEREAVILAKETEQKRQQEENDRKKAEQEKQEKEKELNVEKKKNTYLLAKKTNISEEAEGLIHHIQLFNVDIKYEIDKLIPKIQKKELSDNEIIAQLLKIKIYTEKTIAISNLITGAGFNAKIDKQSINIPVFIDDYIKKYYEYHDRDALQLTCIGSDIAFFKMISPLELSIILDNLISNAKKWKAQHIQFNISKNQHKNLIIDVYDDGLGVSNKLMDNPTQIFELGVTETNGAGIGLYYVKHLLTTMNAEISFIGNNFKLKGAYFQISFFQ